MHVLLRGVSFNIFGGGWGHARATSMDSFSLERENCSAYALALSARIAAPRSPLPVPFAGTTLLLHFVFSQHTERYSEKPSLRRLATRCAAHVARLLCTVQHAPLSRPPTALRISWLALGVSLAARTGKPQSLLK